MKRMQTSELCNPAEDASRKVCNHMELFSSLICFRCQWLHQRTLVLRGRMALSHLLMKLQLH